MTQTGVKPRRQPVASAVLRPKSPPARRDDRADEFEPTRPRAPSRALTMRLAAEVEALSEKLEIARARISELEAHIDVDPLTEVLNRRGFDRELKRSLAYVKRYGASVAVVFIDLDGFKPINDRHGHAAGDAVLKAVATCLTRHVRASDIVARIGGDEFAVLLWNVSGGDAVAKGLALEAAIHATPMRFNDSTLAVGASAGLAYLGALDSPDEVLARADAAMYARKAERGRSGSREADATR